MIDAIPQFRAAIRATGLEPPELVEPGKFYRFAGLGKQQSNQAAWCRAFSDSAGGVFGDWSTGLSETWFASRNKPLSRPERIAVHRQVEEARAKAKAELELRQKEAANKAKSTWAAAPLAPPDHPYLIRKGIQRHGARLRQDSLVLPITGFSNDLTSLQFIYPDGTKILLKGGRKKGCFVHVSGDFVNPSKVITCEGWATGCSLAEDEHHATVLAAIDCHNLLPVALSARRRWPNVEIVIAGDDDRLTPGNPGATKARAAAKAADALIALPQWPENAPDSLSDFNDLANWLRGELI